VIAGAEVDDRIVDVELTEGVVTAVAPHLRRDGAELVDAGGGALIPGLHDHHLHLLAMAAARTSLRLDEVTDLDAALSDAHRTLPPGRWLRAIGLDERHGPIDRHRLDRLAPGRPVRVQDRSGAAWVLSTPALAEVGREEDGDGWLHRADGRLDWPREVPDLTPVGADLRRYGITGVTDATPTDDPSMFTALATARTTGALPQHVAVTGGAALASVEPPAPLTRGPVKVVIADDVLPDPDDLAGSFRAAHEAGRAVAVHCVTRVALALALAAWREVGPVDGDRVEHGAVIPVELLVDLADLGVRVVTQPAFVAVRGDRYLADVEDDDVPHLYRCRTLVDAGVRVAGSSDAPFGPADPWVAIAAAVERTTATGAPIGSGERLTPDAALDLYLGPLDDPGGPPRRIEPGAPADLCLLAVPRRQALRRPSAEHVVASWVADQTPA
jgi:predicted amidohydrolase YtcJ